MDAKELTDQEGQAPPPYSLIPHEQPSSSSHSHFHPSSLTSHLHSHLSALPNRIRQNQQSLNTQQTHTDIWILDHLVPVVESFLADLGTRHTVPPLATLTLVPNAAIPPDAVLSGMEDMLQRKEVGQVFRVVVSEKDSEKGGGDSKGQACSPLSSSVEQAHSARSEFTDWGRWEEPASTASGPSELLWWNDEAMARRLASYLQPQTKPRPPPVVSSPVQAVVEHRIPAEKAKRNWGWGKRRADQTSETVSTSSTAMSRGGRGTVARGDVAGIQASDSVIINERRAEMNATTEKVAFRRENDFGVWESMSGWAVIVVVKVRS